MADLQFRSLVAIRYGFEAKVTSLILTLGIATLAVGATYYSVVKRKSVLLGVQDELAILHQVLTGNLGDPLLHEDDRCATLQLPERTSVKIRLTGCPTD